MLDILIAGGWLMIPILGCSILSMAIICERLWTLRPKILVPKDILPALLHSLEHEKPQKLVASQLANPSPLSKVLAKGLQNIQEGPAIMKLRMEEHGRHVIMELEKYLNALGTIAAISPLLGLLGTVMGMIQVFSVMTKEAAPNPQSLAGGISEALLTTAFGLAVAIPSLMFYRHFQRRIDEIAVSIEREAMELVEFINK